MPYCPACGTKTDFETTDCPSCGEGVPRQIEPPGDEMADVQYPELYRDVDDDSDSDDQTPTSIASEPETTANGTATADSGRPADFEFEVATADESTLNDESTPTTDPDGPSPFADRWSLSLATGYPVRDGYRAILAGSAIEFVSFFIPLVTLLTAGYGFQLLRATARGQQARPSFDQYGTLVADGLKLCFVGVIYGAVFVFGAITAAVVQSVDQQVGIALWLTVITLSVYPLPASLTVYGATDDLRSAFSRNNAGEFATSWTYLKGWIAWLVGIGVVSLLTIVSLITLVGPIVVRAWGIYSLGALWGYYYREAAARGVVPPAPDEPVP